MATDKQAIVDRFKTGTANMMPYGYFTPGSSATTSQGFSPLNLQNARTVTPTKVSTSYPMPGNIRYGRPPESYNAPATYGAAAMPQITGTTKLPTGGSAYTYGQTPYAAGDPNRLAPAPGTALPFINKPPIDITVPTGGAPQYATSMPQGRPGLNIQPFTNQGNVMDPGNEGYVDPMSGYMPQAAPNPAAGAIAGLSPLTASQRINQPFPAAPAAAPAPRTQDRSGTGTDGYVRDASGNVVGRDPKFAGLTPSQMYDQISGRQPAGPTTFSRDMGLERKLAGTGVSVDQYVKGIRDGTYSGLGDVRGRPTTPATRSIAPVTGGLMAPAQRRRAPIMRSA